MMDNFNWLIAELLVEQRMRERLAECGRLPPTPPGPRAERAGVKRALASTFVRLGLRLDPAAGEGLGSPPLPMAQSAGRSL